MKIILTEDQFELLKLIKENENTIYNFQSKFNKITEELNKLFTKINFISVSELIGGEIDVESFLDNITRLDESNLNIKSEMSKYFESFDDDKFEKIYNNLENLYYVNSKKINLISTILISLKDLVDGSEGGLEIFSDIKSINLSL